MISSQDLFETLSNEEIQRILSSCYLSEKSEYTDDEYHIFCECRSLIEQSKSEEELAQHFEYRKNLPAPEESTAPKGKAQSKSRKTASKTKNRSTNANLFNIIDLQSMAEKTAKIKISLPQALEIISICGLPTQDEYTKQECDRFIEGCILKQKGKTEKEIAAFFGIEHSNEQENLLLAEVEQMMDAVIAQVSRVQAEQIKQALPRMSNAQLREIKAKFWQSTAALLREYVDSGQMEVEIRAAAQIVVNEKELTLITPVRDSEQKILSGN